MASVSITMLKIIAMTVDTYFVLNFHSNSPLFPKYSGFQTEKVISYHIM